ncbi:MAG: inorganic phosphate transporter [Solirubrobacterales bacterium]|nr:inorganic phosphate transporter [Solirubrobacterales bacterium]
MKETLLVVVIITALAFDFTNGFHDTANAVAASISTRAMPPRIAVTFSAILNFVGAFISLKVATTIASGIVATSATTTTVVFAALLGAIAWNLVTWWLGLPSSSSHALIGGLVGAAWAASGAGAIQGTGILDKVIVPAVLSPTLAFVVAWASIILAYRVIGRRRPGVVTRGFKLGQVLSSGVLSLSHGTNDGQKTMGVITLALVAEGSISRSHVHVPTWVIIASASAIAFGTYAGGWRIIKTTGMRIIKMDPSQGFAAQSAGAAAILAASHYGFPISTTHVINGGVMGAGAAKRLSAVRWGVAGNIIVAWMLTLPAAAAMSAGAWALTRALGGGMTGSLVLFVVGLLGLLAVALTRRMRSGPVPVAQS